MSLCNKIKSSDLTCFIKGILDIAVANNIMIQTITFDGVSVNFGSVAALGCNFSQVPDEIHNSFSYNEQVVYVIPDPCHMLKLARNPLNDMEVFIDNEGRFI